VDVEEERARRVRGIGGVDAASGEAVDEPRVDRPERISPASARALSEEFPSRSQAILLPEK